MEEENKKKFEIKKVFKDNMLKKEIYIDDELFDWEVDQDSLKEAMRAGPEVFAMVQKDITRHFLSSISEFVGRELSFKDIQMAELSGWI